MKKIAWIPLLVLFFAACTKGTNERYLILKFKFNDTSLPRLNDTGGIATIPRGNEALTPVMNYMASYYAELLPSAATQLGQGTVLPTKASSYSKNGIVGIDFSKLIMVKDGEAFLSIPLSTIKPGSYEWLRLGLAYQNFDVTYRLDTTINSFNKDGIQYPGATFSGSYIGTVASFIGYKNFFDVGYTIKSHKVVLDSQMKDQGYWFFETNIGTGSYFYPAITATGQSLDSATTFVNPIFATSPIIKDLRSIITASFTNLKYTKSGDVVITKAPLVITGAETESIIVECQLSTTKSFEWRDDINNKMWDPFTEPVIDIGIRGMRPAIIK